MHTAAWSCIGGTATGGDHVQAHPRPDRRFGHHHQGGRYRDSDWRERSAREIDAISVKEPFPYSAISEMQPTPPQEFFDAQERIAHKRVEAVVDACQRCRACRARATPSKRCTPGRRSSTTRRTHDCDLLVMASHGRRGVTALLLGSETQKVLTHTTIPVLVVR